MPHELSRTRLDRQRPLRDQVYAQIRRLILTGAMKPGELVDEKSIATQLGISRTPVREAVKKLSDENLIDVVAQSATRVSRIDRIELEQAFLIRRALEMESAAHAARNMNNTHADALSDILIRHARAIERNRNVVAIECDDAFHSYIAGVAGLPRLWRMVEISKAQLDRCRHMMLPLAGEAEITLEYHREIIRALNSRNPDSARAAMGKHLELAYNNAVRAIDAGEIGK